MLDNSVRSFPLSLSGAEDLPSGAKRYTYTAIVELNLDGKDDWRADEVPCRFDVMPGYTQAETVQPDWTTTNMDALRLGVNADVDRLSNLGAQGFEKWYGSLNATGQKCVSGEYFYTSKLGTSYGYKFYNGTLAQNNYDYVFGVFNNSFRHEQWDPTDAVWSQMSPNERTAFLEAEEQVATAYDALALLLGDSKPLYAYESLDAYLEAECGYTEGGSYNRGALADEGYLVVDNLFGDTWTAMRTDVPDDGQALPTIDSLQLSAQSTTRERIGSFQTKDGRGKAANKEINGMTDVDILLDTIKDSTESIMDVITKVDPETGELINGFAVKAAGLAKSIYEPVDDEIKSRSDYTGISSELKNRQEELARMEEMNKFYDRKNPGSLCQKALQAEIEYMKQYIADLEWAKRFAWYGEMGTVTGGAMIEYTGKVNDAAEGYIDSISDNDAKSAATIAWGYISDILDKGKILGLAARQAYGSQAAAASMLMAPDLAKHRAQVQQWRFYRERECKNDDFGELHYHVKPAIDPSGWTYEAVQDNRLEGVTATIYQKIGDAWVVWDAAQYDQTNPQTTTSAGLYAWDVPEGDWKVLFQKAGYLDKWSDVMHVLPAWVNVAINMLRADAPQVASAAGNDDDPYAPYVDITFNQYMNASDGVMPTVTVNGVAVTGAYWVDVVTGTVVTEADGEDENAKVSLVLRVPLADLAEPGDTVTVTVDGAYSYTGVKMTAPYTASITIPDSAMYYYVVPDEVTSYTKGSNEALAFTFKRTSYDERTFPRFQGILVDGAAVDASNYTAAAGSVVVTLKAAYLETLAEGDHALTAQFADGSATADFKVTAAGAVASAWTRGASSPATGDRVVSMGALLIVAAMACGVMLLARNRTRSHAPAGKHARR